MPEQTTSSGQMSDEIRRRASAYADQLQGQYGADASFDSVDSELGTAWAKQPGNEKTEWSLVRGIVKEAWGRRDKTTASADAVANAGGFDHPPTFGEEGAGTPRNRDEPNQ